MFLPLLAAIKTLASLAGDSNHLCAGDTSWRPVCRGRMYLVDQLPDDYAFDRKPLMPNLKLFNRIAIGDANLSIVCFSMINVTN